MLGVNPATLRHWTGSGKLHVYRTPGGHRRFRTAEIAALRQVAESPPLRSALDAMLFELEHRYHGLAHSPSTYRGSLATIDPSTRQRFHALGVELLTSLGAFLSTPAPREKQRAQSTGRHVAAQYGRLLREVGIETAQAVAAYLVFRRPLLDVLSRTLAAHPEMGSQLGRIMRDAERFMDDVLMAITEADGNRSADLGARANAEGDGDPAGGPHPAPAPGP